MREKFAIARQGQRELAAFIKEHPEFTWFDVALAKNVSYGQVCRVAKIFGLSRTRPVKKEE